MRHRQSEMEPRPSSSALVPRPVGCRQFCLLLNILLLSITERVGALPAVTSFRKTWTSHPTDPIQSHNDDDIQELFLEQPLDHFSTDYMNKFPNASLHQRYFYSSRYVSQKNESYVPTYAFLCVGGEGPYLDKSVLIDSVHCTGDMLELAKILYHVRVREIENGRGWNLDWLTALTMFAIILVAIGT